MNNINWDGFRYFIAAAESGSLTGAARRLGSNQPTVGRHIDTLETALGVKLFQRTVKGLLLTEEGDQVLAQVQAMEAVTDQIHRKIQGENTSPSGMVRVALPEGLCQEILTPLLPAFYARYPDIQLILNVSANAANLTRGEADIAVRLFRPEETNLVVKYLGRMTLGLFAAPDYIATHGTPKNERALKRHRLITYGDRLATLPENQWLIKHADTTPSVLSSDNTLTRLRATTAGVGISIQPHLFLHSNPQLIPMLQSTRLPHHDIWMAYHGDLRHASRIRAVVEFLSSSLIGELDVKND